MPLSTPPFALRTPTFQFRQLAIFAGRAPIGGAREVALACFVAARLAAERPTAAPEDSASRLLRAAGAKAWLGTLALPAAVRATLTRCVELSVGGDRGALAHEMAVLSGAAATILDDGARRELDLLAASFRD